MTECSAPPFNRSRFAVLVAAAGFLFVTAASAQTTLPPPAYGNADARQDRIEELEGQLRDAEGRNEQMQRQLNEANREITRLRGMVGELAGVNQSLSAPPADGAAPTGGATPPSGQRSEIAPPSLNDAQRANTGVLGSMPASAVPPPSPADPGQAYSEARELLVAGKYPEAEAAFGQFLEQYPEAPTAADARFWFAFTLLARNNYADAASNFVNYLQNNRAGARAPEAQVRLGMALAGMGQTRQACAAFADLPRRYPNAARNVRDLATRESRAAQCAA